MSFIQTNICVPNAGLVVKGFDPLVGRKRRSSLSLPSQPRNLRVSLLYGSEQRKFPHYKSSPGLVYTTPNYKRCTPVFANGGKGNEAFSWDSLKDAMGSLGKRGSVEDLLKKEMQKREFDGIGGGGSPPGGGGDGSGGPGDGDIAGILDELLQVILATIGFIFVYIYLIRGEELTRLARDYIKFLFGAKPSVRLGRAMDKWRKFYESIAWSPPREDWLEREIVATPTWWHQPRKLVSWMESGRPVKSHDDHNDDS